VSRLNHYFGVGRYYISKRLIGGCAVLILLVFALYLLWIAPLLRGRLWTPTFSVTSRAVMTYAGKIKLVNTDHRLIYEGDFDQGAANGHGTLYDLEGHLTYTGQFIDNRYSGEGRLFHPNGQVAFEGSFQDNDYHGQGRLYDVSGNLIYEGGFLRGRFHGDGARYHPEGPIQFKGYFENGYYQGEGQLWDAQGQLIYAGMFDSGLYNGPGKLYDQNLLRYEGHFQNGLYQGGGILYNTQGAVVCDGAFFSGQPDYRAMLGLDTLSLRKIFPNPSRSITLDEYFLIEVPELQSAFILTYGAQETESHVYEIAFWGGESGLWRLDTLDTPVYEGSIPASQSQRALPPLEGVDQLYVKQYHTDAGYLNLFYAGPDEPMLYLSLGGPVYGH
jgi:antitoxin component YwqK of YwqJK toxin-antitoxin module